MDNAKVEVALRMIGIPAKILLICSSTLCKHFTLLIALCLLVIDLPLLEIGINIDDFLIKCCSLFEIICEMTLVISFCNIIVGGKDSISAWIGVDILLILLNSLLVFLVE